MSASTLRSIALAASLLGILPGGPVSPLFLDAATAGTIQARSVSPRPVTFDLVSDDSSGDIQLGSPVTLSLTLNGIAQGRVPIIAVCESAHFHPHIITMEPDTDSKDLRGTAVLNPVALGQFSVVPTSARIQVTFFRTPPGKKFQRILTRIVYVTVDNSETPPNTIELFSSNDEPSPDENMSEDDIPPDGIPIAIEPLDEENLLPLPNPERGQVYWRHVSARLSRSWSRTARRVRHAPSSETVHVRFRMYPNGRAQLIEIEQGSGAREIDVAGIYAVIHAQPFPPFPEDIGSDPVDVHVRMRTGARRGIRDVQQVTESRPSRAKTPTRTPKP